MQNPTPTRTPPQANARANCLGCTDCAGMCRDVIDLLLVPQMVLHRSAPNA
jgi:hypothetical protein